MIKKFIKLITIMFFLLILCSVSEVMANDEDITITFKDKNFFNNIRYSYEMISIDENTLPHPFVPLFAIISGVSFSSFSTSIVK